MGCRVLNADGPTPLVEGPCVTVLVQPFAGRGTSGPDRFHIGHFLISSDSACRRSGACSGGYPIRVPRRETGAIDTSRCALDVNISKSSFINSLVERRGAVVQPIRGG